MLNGPRGRPTLYDPNDTRAGPSGCEENKRYTLASHPSTDSGQSAASYIPPCKGNGSRRQRPTSLCKGRELLNSLTGAPGAVEHTCKLQLQNRVQHGCKKVDLNSTLTSNL